MIRLVRVINNVNYFTEFEYKEASNIMEAKMRQLALEDKVDVVQAVDRNKLIAWTAKTMDYVRYSDYGNLLK